MSLEQLFDRQNIVRVVLLYTSSSALTLFVQDALRSRFNINKESIIDITTKKELMGTREVFNSVPFLSDRWLFHVKSGDKLIKRDFISLVKDNTSGIYLIEFENYRNYKATKDLLNKQIGVVNLYLAWLNRKDFSVLYNRIVISNKGYNLPKTLLDFVMRGYSAEIDEIFKLFEVLKEGKEVKTRKQIINICGLSSNTIDSFMFSLLKEPTTSDRGLKKYISNRLIEAVDLAEKYTWPTFRNYLKRSVKSCIDIKMILSSGEVYDNIRTYKNDAYNMNQLGRFQRYLPKIKEISITRFLGLLENLEKRIWRNDMDFLSFFFNYMIYKYEANKEVKQLLIDTLNSSKNDKNNKPKASKKIIQKPIQSQDISSLEKERLRIRGMFSEKLQKFGVNG
jgi:hypothetical protein